MSGDTKSTTRGGKAEETMQDHPSGQWEPREKERAVLQLDSGPTSAWKKGGSALASAEVMKPNYTLSDLFQRAPDIFRQCLTDLECARRRVELPGA